MSQENVEIVRTALDALEAVEARSSALLSDLAVAVTDPARRVTTTPMPTWVLQALTAVRKVPWRQVLAAILWLNTEGRNYWNRLSPDERRQVRDLAMKSRGQRSNLTPEDEDRLFLLFRKIRRPGVDDAPGAGEAPV